MPRIRVNIVAAIFVGLVCAARAQSNFDSQPINYKSATPTDRVSKLAEEIEGGRVSLKWDRAHGWLPAILDKLDIPRSSQTLVFSKTSMQFRRISPRRPRAIYFNDDIYVGWVNGGDVVEIGAVDPKLGAVFYSVAQKEAKRPAFTRDRGECMACHENGRTQKVPGFLVRSVYSRENGQPEFRLGSLATDHTTPFKDRFGGWYVTGSHGAMRHRGNVFVSDAQASGSKADPIDREVGANLGGLPQSVRAASYLESTSDIVALMLLEHQTQMHNYVTKAGFTSRQALFQQNEMNAILDRAPDYRSESTIRRINSAVEKLVQYLFFSKAVRFTDPIQGNKKFVAEFESAGVRDSQGRSLRDLDLKTRLLRYPCSFLIYTESFQALPTEVTVRVKKRMLEILQGADQSEEFEHLSNSDRKNILEILSETHPLFNQETR